LEGCERLLGLDALAEIDQLAVDAVAQRPPPILSD
jgi:hypothetical protein